ncbi:MAG: glycosyltransferase family 2 protein [Candidatus Omnitrophota bacterium]
MRYDKISIVVPTYNDCDFLPRCLESLLNQKGAVHNRDYEIIVIDDGSTDGTPETASRYPVKYLRLDRNMGKVTARKTGAENAAHDTLLFVDSRIIAGDDLLESFRRTGKSPLIAGEVMSGGRDSANPDTRLFYLLRRIYYYPYFPFERGKELTYITKNNFNRIPKGMGCCFMTKRLFFSSMPETFGKHTNDDTAIFSNIVYKNNTEIVKCRGIKVTYMHRKGSGDLAAWITRRGITFYDYYMHGHLLFRILVPVSAVLAVFLFASLFFRPLYFLAASGLLAACYLISAIVLSEKMSDFPLVFARFYRYAFLFYFGTLKGWFLKCRCCT